MTGVIERYKQYLPVTKSTPIISLKEGSTPLIKSTRLKEVLHFDFELYLKYEGLNPTGSFKDRGMTVAVSKAVEQGSKAIICASTGNTSASASAYASKAGLRCIVIVPEGAIALGKLSQALMHDAVVLSLKGNFDDALNIAKEISNNYPITLVNSLNPNRIEGQKTASFEIVDDLGDGPDYQFMPVGNAGNITAYWKGYKQYKQNAKSKKLPRMIGVQAKGANPLVKGRPIKNPTTIATAIRIGNPASWQGAINAKNESNGEILDVTDREIINAYKLLAKYEGLFVEPASAASLAGLISYFKKLKGKNLKVVCILTGHGLKDPDTPLQTMKKPIAVDKSMRNFRSILEKLVL